MDICNQDSTASHEIYESMIQLGMKTKSVQGGGNTKRGEHLVCRGEPASAGSAVTTECGDVAEVKKKLCGSLKLEAMQLLQGRGRRGETTNGMQLLEEGSLDLARPRPRPPAHEGMGNF